VRAGKISVFEGRKERADRSGGKEEKRRRAKGEREFRAKEDVFLTYLNKSAFFLRVVNNSNKESGFPLITAPGFGCEQG
jgi:hypothetical protein